MSSIRTFVLLFGSMSLLTVGLDLATESVTRRLILRFKRMIARSAGGAFRDFAHGVFVATPVGSSVPGALLLISSAELFGNEITRHHADTRAVAMNRLPMLMMGMNLGAVLISLLLAATAFTVPLLAVGLTLLTIGLVLRVSERTSGQEYHSVLIGIGIALIGLDLVGGSLDGRVAAMPGLLGGRLPGGLVVVLAWAGGVALGAVTRATLAMIAFAMALGHGGWLAADASVALGLGASLGIGIVGPAASRALGAEAKRASLIFAILLGASNLTGLAVYLTIRAIVLPSLGGTGPVAPSMIPITVGMTLTCAHLATALVVLPLRHGIVALVHRAIPDAASPTRVPAQPSFGLLPENLPDALESNLALLQSALARMAEIDSEMLMIVMNASQEPALIEDSREHLGTLRDTVTKLGLQVNAALTRSVQRPTTHAQAEQIRHEQRVVDELTRISESCAKVARVLRRSSRKGYRVHDEGADELFSFTAQVFDFLRYSNDYLSGCIDSASLELAEQMEKTIDDMRKKLKKRARKVLENDQDAHIRGELAFIEIIGHLEHIGDSCLSIAETVPMLERERE